MSVGRRDGGSRRLLCLSAPAAEAVLDQLRDLDVNETPPVELMATVQEWQEFLEDGG